MNSILSQKKSLWSPEQCLDSSAPTTASPWYSNPCGNDASVNVYSWTTDVDATAPATTSTLYTITKKHLYSETTISSSSIVPIVPYLFGYDQSFYSQPPSSRQLLKDKIRKQMSLVDTTNHRGTQMRALSHRARFEDAQPNEIVALHLLKKMVSDSEFRKYLKSGTLPVRGPSGLVYQLRRNDHMVHVYKQGQLVSHLCVYVHDKSVPPTDNIIAKMVIIQCDEHNIWQRANIYWKGVPDSLKSVKRDSFTEQTLLRLVA